MGNPPDILFRRVFGRVANARDLLRSALPPLLLLVLHHGELAFASPTCAGCST